MNVWLEKLLRFGGDGRFPEERIESELARKRERLAYELRSEEDRERLPVPGTPMSGAMQPDPVEYRRPKGVYDASCGVCSSIREWAEIRLKYPVEFVQVQEDELECVVPNVNRERLRKEFAFQEWDGSIWYGGDAAARLMARMVEPWQIVGRLGMVPPFRQLGGVMYRKISRNRKPLAKGAGKLGHFPQPDRWPES